MLDGDREEVEGVGRLSILGAQRVKALIEKLEEQKKERLKEVEATLPTEDEIRLQVDRELGVDGLKEELDEALYGVLRIAERIKERSGETFRIPKNINDAADRSYRWDSSKREKMVEQRFNESRAVLKEIEAEFKDKEIRLWLCETLEEAKELVGIE